MHTALEWAQREMLRVRGQGGESWEPYADETERLSKEWFRLMRASFYSDVQAYGVRLRLNMNDSVARSKVVRLYEEEYFHKEGVAKFEVKEEVIRLVQEVDEPQVALVLALGGLHGYKYWVTEAERLSAEGDREEAIHALKRATGILEHISEHVPADIYGDAVQQRAKDVKRKLQELSQESKEETPTEATTEDSGLNELEELQKLFGLKPKRARRKPLAVVNNNDPFELVAKGSLQKPLLNITGTHEDLFTSIHDSFLAKRTSFRLKT